METSLIIGLFIGILIRFLMKWIRANRTKQKFNRKLSFGTAFLALVTGIGILYAKEDMQAIFPLTKISMMFIGYTGDSFFRNVMGSIKRKSNYPFKPQK